MLGNGWRRGVRRGNTTGAWLMSGVLLVASAVALIPLPAAAQPTVTTLVGTGQPGRSAG